MSNSINLIRAILGNTFEIQQYFDLIDTESFKNEIRKDLDLISKNALSSDDFFAEHAKYMLNFNFESRQKLGLEMWLSLLDIIRSIDEHKYKDMHKGTAFYHTGIMYLLNDKWTEGFEWLDYAFEQDTKNKTGIVELPATWTLSFDPRLNELIKPHDYEMSTNILKNIRDLFQRIAIFESIFNIQLEDFRTKIKSVFLDASSNRSIRSGWCTFLGNLMNQREVLRYLRLGPKERCVQLTAHKSFVELTLILESLLKNKYTGSTPNPTLGTYLTELVGPELFNNSNVKNSKLIKTKLSHNYTKILSDIQKAEQTENKLAVAYQLAYEVRNHSHHLFNEEEISDDVFSQIFLRLSYAIIMTVDKLY